MNSNNAVLKQLLLGVKSVLDKYNIVFWLEHGTLLGAIRDNGFISWERDIDFGAWKESVGAETWDAVVGDLKAKGYKVCHAPTHINIKSGEIWADIALYQDKSWYACVNVMIPVNSIGNAMCKFHKVLKSPNYYEVSISESKTKHYALIAINQFCNIFPLKLRYYFADVVEWLVVNTIGCKTWRIPAKYFTVFQPLNFCGELFRVPAKPESYLEFRYGNGWRIPKSNWKTANDGGVVWYKR